MKKHATKQTIPGTALKRLTIGQYLMRRLATLSLWYLVIAGTFLLILAWTSIYEPTIVSYMVSGKPALDFLTPAEAAHMADVAQVLRSAMLLALAAVLILVGHSVQHGIDRGMLRAALAMDAVLVVLLIPFDWTFTLFHRAFFPGGNWQFPADSWLITHFSQTFFMIVGFCWIAMTIAVHYTLYRNIDGN